ncbi:YhcH/YjgK/YiaL family protein, partial [Nitrospirota bacterium]
MRILKSSYIGKVIIIFSPDSIKTFNISKDIELYLPENCGKISSMIVDSIDKFSEYFPELGVEEFISDIVPGTPPGKYEIDGENIFAILSTYETSHREERRPEAHREYVDIQILLSGKEIIEWYPIEGMNVELEYDESRDVGFFHLP